MYMWHYDDDSAGSRKEELILKNINEIPWPIKPSVLTDPDYVSHSLQLRGSNPFFGYRASALYMFVHIGFQLQTSSLVDCLSFLHDKPTDYP